jgi:urease accessory protein
VIGEVEIEVVGRRVTTLRSTPPIAAKVLPGPLVVMLGSAAGLLEDDVVRISIRVGDGARLAVRTTAATLAHPCRNGGSTLSAVDIVLGRGAALAWLPEPLVACAGCHHESRARVRLAHGASCVWLESVGLGRHGETAGAVTLRFDAEMEGQPLLRDGMRWPTGADADEAVAYGRARHLAALHLLGRRARRDVPAASDGPAGDGAAGDRAAVALDLAGPGCTVRAMAIDAHELARQLGPFQSSFLSAIGFDPVAGVPRQPEALVHV